MHKKITKIATTIFTVLAIFLGLNIILKPITLAQGYDDTDWEWDTGTEYSYGSTGEAPAWLSLPFIICSCLFGLAIYVYMAVSLSKIAVKAGFEDKKVLAWIPFANIYLMVLISGKPIWWIALFFVPIANFVVPIILWMEIAQAVKHPKWLGILMLIFPINIFVPGYLAFVEGKEKA